MNDSGLDLEPEWKGEKDNKFVITILSISDDWKNLSGVC